MIVPANHGGKQWRRIFNRYPPRLARAACPKNRTRTAAKHLCCNAASTAVFQDAATMLSRQPAKRLAEAAPVASPMLQLSPYALILRMLDKNLRGLSRPVFVRIFLHFAIDNRPESGHNPLMLHCSMNRRNASDSHSKHREQSAHTK